MSRMAQPWKHPKTGTYYFRKVVPAELRYALGKVEWKVSLKTKELSEARRKYLVAATQYEEAAAAVRKGYTTLSHKDRMALASKWRKAQLAEQEENPEEAEYYRIGVFELSDLLERSENDWMPLIEGDVEVLLRSENILLPKDSEEYVALANEMAHAKCRLWASLARRAEGDFGEPEEADTSPEWRGPADNSKTLQWAYDQWKAERRPASSTIREYAGIVKAFGATRVLAKINPEDVRLFKDQQVVARLKPNSIDKKLSALRSIFGWALNNRYIQFNPTVGVSVEGLKRDRSNKSRKPYSREDAAAILEATRAENGSLRWVPWLLASTGCRSHEACQALFDVSAYGTN